MIKRPKLVTQLIRDEGDRQHAYRDSKGFLTIGVGFLVDERKGGGLPSVVRDVWLQHLLDQFEAEVSRNLPFFYTLSTARQEVLLNMAYNMGTRALLGFKRTLAHIERQEFDKAATEMLDSVWASEVKGRAVRLSKQMRTGVRQ